MLFGFWRHKQTIGKSEKDKNYWEDNKTTIMSSSFSEYEKISWSIKTSKIPTDTTRQLSMLSANSGLNDDLPEMLSHD